MGNQHSDNTAVYTVSPAHIFIVGDNRDNSNDSRRAQFQGGIGFVPIRNIVGILDDPSLGTGSEAPR